MTDEEFMRQTQEQLEELRINQKTFHLKLATDFRRLLGVRTGLGALAGALALGLGVSVGYQLARR